MWSAIAPPLLPAPWPTSAACCQVLWPRGLRWRLLEASRGCQVTIRRNFAQAKMARIILQLLPDSTQDSALGAPDRNWMRRKVVRCFLAREGFLDSSGVRPENLVRAVESVACKVWRAIGPIRSAQVDPKLGVGKEKRKDEQCPSPAVPTVIL